MMDCSVHSNSAQSHRCVGGKARTLLELRAAGFRIPDFEVSPRDLEQSVRRLGVPLAVRSSASLEDGSQASFAGQFCSRLNLRTIEEVREAVAECEGSGQRPSVVDYCRQVGLRPDDVRMSVIVQRMIQPELAGVAFSVNPVTGSEEVVIEACEGLADGLLAGRCVGVPASHPSLRKYRQAIEDVVLAIQRHYGMPQDIEFAIEDGQVYVLQARPITRITFTGIRGEWTNADFRDGGVSASVCSPLMASLYEMVWNRALKKTLRELRLQGEDFEASRIFFSRPYWNVGAVKRAVSQLPGYCERDFDRDLSIPPAYRGDGDRTPVTIKGIMNAIPTLWGVRRFLRRQQACARRWLDGNEARRLDRMTLPATVDRSRFQTIIENEYLPLETDYFRTIYAVSLAKMDLLGSFPEADDRGLIASLPPLSHMAPIREVRQMPQRGVENLRELLLRYRHHCRLGLDVCHPRWDEDQDFVVQMLSEIPTTPMRDTTAVHERALAAVRDKLGPWQRLRLDGKVRRLRALVWLREEMRDLSNRMYYVVRRLALALARTERIGDDIFMLTFGQLVSNDRSRLDLQRNRYLGYRNHTPPNEIGDRYSRLEQPASANSGCAIDGLGASSGQARGRVHVARDVEQVVGMPEGSVLVCPYTDPGWTPVLSRVAAVVTETGGLLSHAAVICREFGIPAVLGVNDATNRLRTGDEVLVCGTEGTVKVVSITEP